jgi:DNA-binding NtrC family response regulator
VAILKDLGVGVRATADVAEAAGWVGGEAFCVAMIVLRPPDLAGLSVAQALRERCKLTQLVFISPIWDAELLKRATAFGRSRTLETPKDLNAFRELLRRQITTWTTTASVGIRGGGA